MLTTVLEENGFTPKEAKIYIAWLELWCAPASSIARHCGENRVTVYTILKDLCKKWVSNEVLRNNVKYYKMQDPKDFVEKQERITKKLKEVLPEFLAIANTLDSKPKVQYFEGEGGIKKLYMDLLSSENEDIHSFFNFEGYPQKLIDDLIKDYVPLRVKKKIFAKVIVWNTSRDHEYKVLDEAGHYKKTIVIQEELFKLRGQIDIYAQNKVALIMSHEKELFGIIITSKMAHDTLKTIFDLVRRQNWWDN